MWDTAGVLKQLSQHPSFNIAVQATPTDRALTRELNEKILLPHRLEAYLFILMVRGRSTHLVDRQEVKLRDGELLMVLPQQIHCIPSGWGQAKDYYKLAFDESCLRLLPQGFDLLHDPLQRPVIRFPRKDLPRILSPLQSLHTILAGRQLERTPLLGPLLHLLLAEINYQYFRQEQPAGHLDTDMGIYIGFKKLVDHQYSAQPAIPALAATLVVSENKLYGVVRKYAGVSPKEYMTRRIILEAQRILFYEPLPAKELAYRLGFNDPDYFHRLFKKNTGRTVSAFVKEAKALFGMPAVK